MSRSAKSRSRSLYVGHALQPAERRDHPEEQRHLRDLGQIGLAVDDRTRRVDPGGEQVEHQAFDGVGERLRLVVVRREHVPVRDEVEALVSLVLQADGVADVPGPMADMQRPGRSEARQHARAAVGGGGGLVDGR